MPESQRPQFVGQLGDKQVMVFTASRVLGTAPFTANTTVRYQLPTPGSPCEIIKAHVRSDVVGNDADGTLVVRIFTRKAVDDSRVQVTADFNVEGVVAREKTQLTVQGTLAQRQMVQADALEVDLISNSAAIDTQPTELTFDIEYAILS